MAEGDRSEQSTSGRSVRRRVSWANVTATLLLLVALIIFGTIAYESRIDRSRGGFPS
jgi:hypothetical protein